jgi:hypothetical protein
LGTAVVSLASLFAIVFSVSLLAVQLVAGNLSHRLIRLYVWNWNFLVPFGLSAFALLFNLILLFDESFSCCAVQGVFLTFLVVLALIPFLIFTIWFLIIRNVVNRLLHRINDSQILTENFADDNLYLDYLQPVEDVISSCTRKGDYATSKDLIDLVAKKMFSTLHVVKLTMKAVPDKATCDKLLSYMSEPFAKLLKGVAVSANKNDEIEVSIYVINMISRFVEEFGDARFIPAFKVFEAAIEGIRSQAKYRFSSAEYAVDFARLEVAISKARVVFSQFVE